MERKASGVGGERGRVLKKGPESDPPRPPAAPGRADATEDRPVACPSREKGTGGEAGAAADARRGRSGVASGSVPGNNAAACGPARPPPGLGCSARIHQRPWTSRVRGRGPPSDDVTRDGRDAGTHLVARYERCGADGAEVPPLVASSRCGFARLFETAGGRESISTPRKPEKQDHDAFGVLNDIHHAPHQLLLGTRGRGGPCSAVGWGGSGPPGG